MPDNNSPVFETVNDIVGLFELGTKTCVRSYKNEVHFRELWALLSLKPEQLAGLSKTYVIVWDGIPSGSGRSDVVDTGKYLTPVDWAVAFSIHIVDSLDNKRTAYPDLKIIMLNLMSKSFAGSDSLRYAAQFPMRDMGAMPWIRIFSPGDGNNSWNMEAFFNNLTDKADVPLCAMKDYSKKKPDIGLLKNMWAAFLTKPSNAGEHHALANLVGPLLLTKSYNADIQVKAISNLMRVIGLLPDRPDERALLSHNEPWINWNNKFWSERLSGIGNKLNVFLVDDQHEEGWGQLLCMALDVPYSPKEDGTIGENKNGAIKAFKSSAILEKTLSKGDQKFSLSLEDNESPEILFLDLRLFAGNFDNEVEFFRRLLTLADDFLKNMSANLPWTGSLQEDIVSIKKWMNEINKGPDDDEYIKALTILPRLLSLIDLSYPIIIFSSTGRRDIAEKLKPYGNIITVFDKPKFTVDIPVDIAEQTKRKFCEATLRALELIEGRKVCKAIEKLQNKALTLSSLSSITSFPPTAHVEIYIDESGSSGGTNFSVGGLIFTFPTYEESHRLSDRLKDNGIYWHRSCPNDSNLLSKEPGFHNQNYRQDPGISNWTYAGVLDCCEVLCGDDIRIAAVRVTENSSNITPTCHFPLMDVASEAQYSRLLAVLLELTLFELLPSFGMNKNVPVSISIFAGTRTPPLNFPATAKPGETPTDYYGFDPHPSAPGQYFTISKNSITSIVAGVLASRHDLPQEFSVHHSRGITLKYGQPIMPLDRKSTRVQHYLADHAVKSINTVLFKEHFELGFDITMNGNLKSLLEAKRDLLDGDISSAALNAARCSDIDNRIMAYLLSRVYESMRVMKGSTFMDLCPSFQIEDEKEIIAVIRNEMGQSGRRFLCSRSDGSQVLVTEKWTKKLPRSGYDISPGDKLSVRVIKTTDNILLGTDVAVA